MKLSGYSPNTLRVLIRSIVSETLTISFGLFKIMVPILLLVKGLEMLGATAYLAVIIAPLMSTLGLPPEMGIVWAGTLLSNIYTGMVLFVSEPGVSQLSVQQVTLLGLLMLIAHSMPIELRVAQKIGVSIGLSFVLRIVTAYAAAWVYFQWLKFFSPEPKPANTLWNPVIEHQTLFAWLLSQAGVLMQIVVIIAVLVIFLRVIRVLKLDRLIHLVLRPILPLLGLTEKATNVILVGMTLGLSYGGGMLIQESRLGLMSARELFFSVCLLLLCHGLIEDTLLILLLGADIYGILAFRLVFSFALIAAMVYLLRQKEDNFFSRRLLNRNYRASQS